MNPPTKSGQAVSTMHFQPGENVLRFSVGESSVFRFWVHGEDAYLLVRQATVKFKISMHKSGETVLSRLGHQGDRRRLHDRVDVGSGWGIALFLVFPNIALERLEKPEGRVRRELLIRPAPVGKKKNLIIYSSAAHGADPPPFGKQESIGPFLRRDSGSYWIYCTETVLAADEERGVRRAKAELLIPLNKKEMPKIDLCLLWFPQPEQVKYPMIICVPTDRRNVHLDGTE